MIVNYSKGAAFMMAEKLVKMLTQLIMVVFLTRYLAPSEFGALMYCYAIVSMIAFINTLGMENILVKRFVDFSTKRHSYLKHGLMIRFGFSFLCVAIANFAGLFLVDDSARLLLFVISLYHLAMPMTVYTWLYQAEGRSDLAAIGLMTGSLVGFVFRLYCLFSGASLIGLAWGYLIELVVMGGVYLYFSREHIQENITQLSYERSSNLLKDCLPLIFSGAIVLLYMKVDQIMLGSMVDQAEVGIYVAATRLSEAWYFVGLTLISVYFPKMLNIKNSQSQQLYLDAIVKNGRWIIWGAFTLALVTSFIAGPLIGLLYGKAYAASASVLVVSIWAVPFVYLGAIASKMYVAEYRQGLIFWRSCWGLLINVILNFWLIPIFGAVGAAIATLVSQVAVGVLFNMFGVLPSVLSTQFRMVFDHK
jgi:O-antigen/teichoic acid export membrane protein